MGLSMGWMVGLSMGWMEIPADVERASQTFQRVMV